MYILVYFVEENDFNHFQTIEILNFEVSSNLFLFEHGENEVADFPILILIELVFFIFGGSLLLYFERWALVDGRVGLIYMVVFFNRHRRAVDGTHTTW